MGISERLNGEALADKDRFDTETVPPRGPELLASIAGARREGCPCWVLCRGLYVPRLAQVPVPHPRGGYSLSRTLEEAVNVKGRPFLRPEVAMALDHHSAETQHQLATRPHAVAQWQRLTAAALRDLAGWSPAAVADELGYPDEARADGRVREGRQLWARLSAWPWRISGTQAWWREATVEAETAFVAWRDPEGFVRRESRQRRQAGPVGKPVGKSHPLHSGF